jgi:hypothetical protein
MSGKTRNIAPPLLCEKITKNGRNELQILDMDLSLLYFQNMSPILAG